MLLARYGRHLLAVIWVGRFKDNGKRRVNSIHSGHPTSNYTFVAALPMAPQYTMRQKARPSLCVSPTTRWAGTPLTHQHIFRGRRALVSPTRSISTSSMNMRQRRSRPYQRPLIFIREVGRNRGILLGKIVGGAFLAVTCEIVRLFFLHTLAMTDSGSRLRSVPRTYVVQVSL